MSTIISVLGLGVLFVVFGLFVRHRGREGHGCRSGQITACSGCRIDNRADQPGSIGMVGRAREAEQPSVPAEVVQGGPRRWN